MMERFKHIQSDFHKDISLALKEIDKLLKENDNEKYRLLSVSIRERIFTSSERIGGGHYVKSEVYQYCADAVLELNTQNEKE